MIAFEKVFLYFLIYSFIGWIMEEVYVGIELKKIVNRGFLIGPICPIYGIGFLLLYFLIKTSNPILVFLESIVICSILEYSTSYILEKVFNARWWDYSKEKFNLNGRICAKTMIPFGIIGTIFLCIVQPRVQVIINYFNPMILSITSLILGILFISDVILSFKIMHNIGKKIKFAKIDNTEEIKDEVSKWLLSKSFIYRRIKKAYPNYRIRMKKMRNNIKEALSEYIEEAK